MDEALELLATELAAAHRDPRRLVPADQFSLLDAGEAHWVQQRTMRLLGETAGVTKVALNAAGSLVAAPIYSSLVATSGAAVDLPPRGWLGLEVELAVRLRSAITADIADGGNASVLDAIESLHLGVEIVGSRFADRAAAGAGGALADNLNTAGYVWSTEPWTGGIEVEGLPIEVIVDCTTRWSGRARLLFGPLITPLIANASEFACDLASGMLVTTGTLCGLVEMNEPGHVVARLGDAAVEFTVRRMETKL